MDVNQSLTKLMKWYATYILPIGPLGTQVRNMNILTSNGLTGPSLTSEPNQTRYIIKFQKAKIVFGKL